MKALEPALVHLSKLSSASQAVVSWVKEGHASPGRELWTQNCI